ncbi:hypothetical protein ABB37_02029 [Leptomonas pyrrhocoris]|uniref:Meckel syndrome type 1 protein n=1 Tax=Leptomonas pyrrhocoris TaxID=157538 RepID=A0A0M9G6X2_LEPPY|nr:hypothetical protein ABB37_02029 [Leptomonas pyrrhocoris]KPA83820.1 hypothetical protein ABB37_02029 [Leptomonas pyrrhocoris]|eukprot:XP_015662259.1 hypothetical protein ABB37_02029 [Leptomonas pyrrhocoris]
MDFVHFLKSQRYRSRVPLRQLQFTVAVYRAIVVEEANVELLAEVTVPWDGKVCSPRETLDLYKDLTHLTQRPTNSDRELRAGPLAETAPAASTTALGMGPSTSGAAAAVTNEPSSAPNVLALPTPNELIAELQKPPSNFFTRPSREDFIDRAEEDFPVDPPQGPSLLAPIILRQHRRDHQPNRKMFLMWASGDVVVPEKTTSAIAPVDDVRAAENGTSSNVVVSTAALPLFEVDALTWKGVERVMCTLTAEPDEHVFTARPNLNDAHTLFVDAAHIYTFRVTVSKATWAGGPPRRTSAGEIPNGALDAVSAPLDAVLANVRELAQYAEEQYEQLDISKDVVARRLLRQAALLVPPERGRTGPPIVAASGAAAPPAEEGGGRARRASFNYSVSAGAAGERGASVVMGGTSMSAAPRGPGMSGVLLSRSSVMRTGYSLPRGLCQYYLFGTVDRCVGIAESTLFLRCQLVEDGEASTWMYDGLAASSPSAVCEFSSQLAYLSTFVEHECVLDVDHVFNLPFEYNFVGAALPRSPLRLVVSAFTEGAAAAGVQSAVAYACLSLPVATPGRHTMTAAMWAPHKSGVEFLRSALLGGAPSLVDARQAGPPPTHRTGISVKEGLYADSVGRVHLTVNILHHRSHDSA